MAHVRTDTSENKDPFTCGWLLIRHDLHVQFITCNSWQLSVLDGYNLLYNCTYWEPQSAWPQSYFWSQDSKKFQNSSLHDTGHTQHILAAVKELKRCAYDRCIYMAHIFKTIILFPKLSQLVFISNLVNTEHVFCLLL